MVITMTFIVARTFSNSEINQAYEKHYSSRFDDTSFSLEKNEYQYHGNDESIVSYCRDENISWEAWLAGWKNCISNLKIDIPNKDSITLPKAYLFTLKECAKAVSEAGVETSRDTGYYLIYKSVEQFMDFIKAEFEKEFPLPEYAKYIPQWNNYKAVNRENYEKYKHEISDYCNSWTSWKSAWKKAISQFKVELPSQFKVSSDTTSFEIIEQAEKALMDAGFKNV